MNKKYCDICGDEIRNASPGEEFPRGNLAKLEKSEATKTEKHIFVQTSYQISPLTDKEYLGIICSECYEKILGFIKGLQNGRK